MFQKKPKLESRKPWKFLRWHTGPNNELLSYDDWGWMEVYSNGEIKEVYERPTDDEIKNRNRFK